MIERYASRSITLDDMKKMGVDNTIIVYTDNGIVNTPISLFQLLNDMKKMGVLDNTIIVYTG